MNLPNRNGDVFTRMKKIDTTGHYCSHEPEPIFIRAVPMGQPTRSNRADDGFGPALVFPVEIVPAQPDLLQQGTEVLLNGLGVPADLMRGCVGQASGMNVAFKQWQQLQLLHRCNQALALIYSYPFPDPFADVADEPIIVQP